MSAGPFPDGRGLPPRPGLMGENSAAVMEHEFHANVAEYRMRHDGETSDALLAYIVGCGLASKRL